MEHQASKILVIGAYGLIGSAVARGLCADGLNIICFGRNKKMASRVMPDFDWVFGDLRDYTDPQSWDALLGDFDFVVNCAGQLQDGASQVLDDVHHGAVSALAAACKAHQCWLIQISAVGAHESASTAFLRTKAVGDEAIWQSGCDHTIFRPGLVLSSTAYGGTQLMRMLAAVPFFQPIANPDTRMQTISVTDITHAVSQVIAGSIPNQQTYDLVEDDPHRLADIIASMRSWLGFAPARITIVLPAVLTKTTGFMADLLGLLGWRSPLRSTAMKVMRDNVVGDPETWRLASGQPIVALSATLQQAPATSEDRLSARMLLLMPIIVLILSAFWIVSGVIALLEVDAAAAVLTNHDWDQDLAKYSVGLWAFIDIALGIGILIRKWAKMSCLLMVAVCIIYLISASLFTPEMWTDPLGPLIKIFPAIMLALVTRILLDER